MNVLWLKMHIVPFFLRAACTRRKKSGVRRWVFDSPSPPLHKGGSGKLITTCVSEAGGTWFDNTLMASPAMQAKFGTRRSAIFVMVCSAIHASTSTPA